jgi:chromosome segregation ATPase
VVLVASAFLLGLVLGAAVFVGIWRTTATRSDRADAARTVAARHLRDARARSATLSTQLHRANSDLASTKRQRQQLKIQLRDASQQAAVAGRQATSDRASVLTLRHRASTVTSYVASLEAYVKATPSQDLDAAFLGSQLVYLSAAAHRLQTP